MAIDFKQFSDVQFGAYLAGFTDGEGCVSVPTLASDVRRITLTNTVPEILYAIRDRLGYGAVDKSERKNKKHKTVYRYRITSCTHLRRYLRLVMPWLLVKKDVAQVLLNSINQHEDSLLAYKRSVRVVWQLLCDGERPQKIARDLGIDNQVVYRIKKAGPTYGDKYRGHRSFRSRKGVS